MASQDRVSKTKWTKTWGTRAQLSSHAQNLNAALEGPRLQAGANTLLVLTPSSQSASPTTSHTDPAPPRLLQHQADQWRNHQSLIKTFNVHKRRCLRSVNPVARQAVTGIDISLFVQPTGQVLANNHASGYPPGPPPEDLNYSLRNFVIADPVQDSNALYARIAVREGRIMAGFVPALPQPGLATKNDSEQVGVSEVAGSGSEMLIR